MYPEPAEIQTDAEQTRRLRHVNRLYAVLSAVNRAVTRKMKRLELLNDICRILVEVGQFRMAWFGVPDEEGWIVPEAEFGDTKGYLTTIRTSVSDIPQGRGPTGTAIRENRPVICNDTPANPVMNPWRNQTAENGFNSNGAFPVSLPCGTVASLALYSSECDFFSSDEEKLLVEICADIGFALEFAATEERRASAEMDLEREQARLKALLVELTESEQKFRTFGNVAQDAIVLLDDRDVVTFWNSAAERIFGYRADEILGKCAHSLLTPTRHRAIYRAASDHFARTGDGSAMNRIRELSALRSNGEEFPVEISLAGFRIGDRWHAAGILRDITERKKNESILIAQAKLLREEVAQRRAAQELLLSQQEELEKLNSRLEERVAEEVQKNRAKDRSLMHNEKMISLGQLAAGVAHEINNPMGYIASNLRVLSQYFDQLRRFDRLREEADDTVPPLNRESVTKSREELDIENLLKDGADLISESLDGAQRVTDIVQDLKSFSRLDADTMQAVSLESCMERALNICHNELKYLATIRKVYLPGPKILCHPGQLNQVFLNLLVNAGQAITPPGEILLKCWHDTEFVYASVSDTGSGIPEEVMERIFDPFFTTKEEGQGTGLGLSISHEIIKRHHGELLLESIVGQGTTFRIRLPRTPELPA